MATSFCKDLGTRPEMKWLPVDVLMVDHNYQREARGRRVQRIAANFSWRAFQPPTVAPDGKGRYFIIDGQHRVLAAKAHPLIDEVPCYVVDAPEMRDQAGAFITTNTERANVTPVALYWAGVAAGNPEYLKLKGILDRADVEVAETLGETRAGATNSVTSIKRALERCGEEALILALTAIRKAYPMDKTALAGNMITALSMMARDNKEVIDGEHLAATLRGFDPGQLGRDALAFRNVMGGSAQAAMRQVITRAYNRPFRGRDGRRLSGEGVDKDANEAA